MVRKKSEDGSQTFKYGELTKTVLSYIVDSLMAGYSAAERRHPLALSVIYEGLVELVKQIKKYPITRAKALKVLRSLEKQEIIDLQEKNDKVFVYLKDRFHPKVVEYSIKSLLDLKKKQKTWSGKWFLVFFDVPEKQRNKRDYLRKFLVKLGFYPYQKSVYLFPYECEKEVKLIKKIVEGAKYMKYIIAEKIEDELSAKRHFNLV